MLVARTEDSDIAQSEFSTSRYDLYATIPSEEQFYTDVNEIYKSVLNRDSISPTEYTFNSRSQLPAGTPWWLEFLPYLVLIGRDAGILVLPDAPADRRRWREDDELRPQPCARV